MFLFSVECSSNKHDIKQFNKNDKWLKEICLEIQPCFNKSKKNMDLCDNNPISCDARNTCGSTLTSNTTIEKSCDFLWHFCKISTTIIQLSPCSKFIHKQFRGLKLQFALPPNGQSADASCLDELESFFNRNPNSALLMCPPTATSKSTKSVPQKGNLHNSEIPLQNIEKSANFQAESTDLTIEKEDCSKRKNNPFPFYKTRGEHDTAEDIVAAYIAADKREQKERFFRYGVI